jgi:hypothetical protein
MQEEWRSIEGFEGLYCISNLGRVKAFARSIKRGAHWLERKERILKVGQTRGHEYECLRLGKLRENSLFYIHRLVALAFIPNPKGLPFVNHLNSNKADNRIENLEWCTNAHNIQHASKNGKLDHSYHSKPILLIDSKNPLLTLSFPSAAAAARHLGVTSGAVFAATNGRRPRVRGWNAKYV